MKFPPIAWDTREKVIKLLENGKIIVYLRGTQGIRNYNNHKYKYDKIFRLGIFVLKTGGWNDWAYSEEQLKLAYKLIIDNAVNPLEKKRMRKDLDSFDIINQKKL